MTLLWVKDNENLPPGRCRDDGEGGLQIREVQPADSGVYMCIATAGSIVNTAKATLAVGGEEQSSQFLLKFFELLIYQYCSCCGQPGLSASLW